MPRVRIRQRSSDPRFSEARGWSFRVLLVRQPLERGVRIEMCWKHELARSVNNLNWALIHLNRARDKLHDRRWMDGEARAAEVIETLMKQQQAIRELVEQYGITRKENERSTARHLDGRRKIREVRRSRSVKKGGG